MSMQPADPSGIVTRLAARSVDETADALRTLLGQRGIMLFALVDHGGEAARVGLTMPLTQFLVFGSPKAGTPVMLAAPTSAIDLPLKLLVWEGPDGRTRISYSDPAYLQDRHHIPPDLIRNLAAAGAMADEVAT